MDMLIQSYVERHFISSDHSQSIEKSLREFKAYVSQFPDVLKLTVCVSGSYASGLASQEDSNLDVVVIMDGGALTNSLDRDQLVLALSTGLKDWENILELKTTQSNPRLLVADLVGNRTKFYIRTCKPRTFPLNELYHAKLFSSYSFCDPRISIVISLVKRWARKSGFSSDMSTLGCPFSGFHWTIIVSFFLLKIRMLPNLHRLTSVANHLPKEVYGPRQDRDSFVLVSDRSIGEKLTQNSPTQKLPLSRILVEFFGWLSELDLLSQCIALQSTGSSQAETPVRLGWINVVDPCKAGWVSVIDPSISQKSQVLFALRLSRYARKLFAKLQGSDERTITNLLTGRMSPDGPSPTYDRAVP